MGGNQGNRIFAAELLYKTKNTEAFFEAARIAENIVPTDLEIFKAAIKEHLKLEYPVSINLNVETFFDNRLIETIKILKSENQNLDCTKICLEITEQGKIPAVFDDKKLIALKDMGFTLALDDFHPEKDGEWQRLRALGEFVDRIKFPHEIMTDIRKGQSEKISRAIREVRFHYPDIILIIEGFQKDDWDSIDLLQSLGIDIIQESSYISTKQDDELKALALTL